MIKIFDLFSKSILKTYRESTMHPQRVTVSCGFWAGEVVGPYFFKNDIGNAVTVNCECYRNMITEFLSPVWFLFYKISLSIFLLEFLPSARYGFHMMLILRLLDIDFCNFQLVIFYFFIFFSFNFLGILLLFKV